MGVIAITGGFTLDDTVLLDGRVMRKAPGGNILYGAVGAHIWHDEVGLCGVAGADYPQAYLDRLQAAGFDVGGVVRVAEPCLKVWALHESEKSRQLVYRLDSGTNEAMDPRAALIPEAYAARVSGVHIAAIPVGSQRALIEKFGKYAKTVTLDTIEIKGRIDPRPLADGRKLDGVDVFSPSIEEVRAIYGDRDVREVMKETARERRGMVVKCGKAGALVCDGATGALYRVPVFPVNAVDTTGAGDAFCGGLLAGLDLTGDILRAAAMGAVSSSFVIEDFGAVHALRATRQAARERFEKVYDGVEEI